MGWLSAPSAFRQPLRRPWTRSRPRRWTRPNRFLPPDAVFALIPSLPRCELARLTDRMINRMDEIDGDPDLEDTREDWEDNHDREHVDEA